VKKFLWKARVACKRILYPCIFSIIGILLMQLPSCPGKVSNLIAWAETDGGPFIQFAGAIVACIGILWLFKALRQIRNTRTMEIYPLRCSVHQNVFDKLLQRLWKEYFKTPLQINVLCTKHGLTVTGEVPPDWNDTKGLEQFLSQRIFSITGYWGPIRLKLSTQKKKHSP
jgi:hypothetical protein